jgi:hypothetical protein
MPCYICQDGKLDEYPNGRDLTVDQLRWPSEWCWFCSTVLDAIDIFRPGWTSDHLTDGKISCINRGGKVVVRLSARDDYSRFFLYQHQGMSVAPSFASWHLKEYYGLPGN